MWSSCKDGMYVHYCRDLRMPMSSVTGHDVPCLNHTDDHLRATALRIDYHKSFEIWHASVWRAI